MEFSSGTRLAVLARRVESASLPGRVARLHDHMVSATAVLSLPSLAASRRPTSTIHGRHC